METQSLATQNRLGSLVRGPDGSLIDSTTGLPFTGRDSAFDQNDETFQSKTFVASVRIPRDRNSYSITATYGIRDTKIADVTAGPGRSDKSISVSASWNHRFTPEVSSIATASYSDSLIDSRTGSNGTGNNNTIRGQIALEYALSPSLKGSAGYAFIRRENSGAQFSSNEFTGKYNENVLFLTLRKTF